MLTFIFGKYGVDTVGLYEVCINWSNFKASQMPSERRTTSTDTREAALIREQLASFIIDYGINHTGLGGWSWYQVEGEPGHRTYFITAYTP